MADLRITDDEAAILRSWLAGNHVQDIAKARRVLAGQVTAVLRDLCGLDRDRGRQVLDTGIRPQPAQSAAVDDTILAAVEAERDQMRAERDAARGALRAVTAERDAAWADLATRPAPLDEYNALRCPQCRWVGFDTHHHTPLQPVTVAILHREATG